MPHATPGRPARDQAHRPWSLGIPLGAKYRGRTTLALRAWGQEHHNPPVQLAIDYPERPLNRLTTAFRPFVAIPILIVLGTVSGGSIDWTRGDTRTTVASAGGLLFLGPLLMILVRGRYPGWWFDWNLNLLRFGTRVAAYIALLDDRYPSTEDEQAVHFDMPRPNVAAGDTSRSP